MSLNTAPNNLSISTQQTSWTSIRSVGLFPIHPIKSNIKKPSASSITNCNRSVNWMETTPTAHNSDVSTWATSDEWSRITTTQVHSQRTMIWCTGLCCPMPALLIQRSSGNLQESCTTKTMTALSGSERSWGVKTLKASIKWQAMTLALDWSLAKSTPSAGWTTLPHSCWKSIKTNGMCFLPPETTLTSWNTPSYSLTATLPAKC